MSAVRVRAFAKINLSLRITGVHDDGYHELRTVFQSVALHDTLTFTAHRGPFAIETNDPDCPADATNLVWRAADALWSAAGRRGARPGVHVRIDKRIPARTGLGGGSSDAAAALRALVSLWRLRASDEVLHAVASALGADVAFFLKGGTALGFGRGDLLFPLPDPPARHIVIARPDFGVSTADAYRWWDDARERGLSSARRPSRPDARLAAVIPPGELRNDLEGPVAEKHPDISRLVDRLAGAGAEYAAMSGSGSAVFGLFGSRTAAERAAAMLGRKTPLWTAVTTTLSARRFARGTAPRTR